MTNVSECLQSNCQDYVQLTEAFQNQTLLDCIEECYSAEDGQTQSFSIDLPLPACVGIASVLVLFSGLFSGLTLGLLSLDLVGLRILEEGGDAREKRYARKIKPVREHGNLLLCTLLFGNVVVNSAISILLSDLTSGVVGLFASTIIILIVGEILPQSVCSRHGLMIGAYSIWLVKLFMVIFFPISWPISKFLDLILGRDVGMVYSQEELKRLIDLHYNDPEARKESCLTQDDHKLLMGSLEYKAKEVRNVMTSLENCFMLDKNTRLDFKTLADIYKSGYSRIPVYDGCRHNIVGVLYVKDLILVDPHDEIELETIMGLRGHGVGRMYEDVTLDKVLKKFMTSYKHLLIVHERLHYDMLQEAIGNTAVVGLITLEDVIEEVLQDEILDETDDVGNSAYKPFKGLAGTSEEMSVLLKFFDHQLHGTRLSQQEVKAICAFLVSNVEEFRAFRNSEVGLANIIQSGEVLEFDETAGRDSKMLFDVESQASIDAADRENLVIYRKQAPSPFFTLVLQGKVFIKSGMEDFTLELGPWSSLGNKALSNKLYVPDFEASCAAPCRILRIHKKQYKAALRSCSPSTGSDMEDDSIEEASIHSLPVTSTGPYKNGSSVRSASGWHASFKAGTSQGKQSTAECIELCQNPTRRLKENREVYEGPGEVNVPLLSGDSLSSGNDGGEKQANGKVKKWGGAGKRSFLEDTASNFIRHKPGF